MELNPIFSANEIRAQMRNLKDLKDDLTEDVFNNRFKELAEKLLDAVEEGKALPGGNDALAEEMARKRQEEAEPFRRELNRVKRQMADTKKCLDRATSCSTWGRSSSFSASRGCCRPPTCGFCTASSEVVRTTGARWRTI